MTYEKGCTMLIAHLRLLLAMLLGKATRRTDRGASAVEYVLILIGAVAICGIVIVAVTQYVTSQGNSLNGN
ncbi:hypothetical protein [Nocardioides bruguierae]|uniref:Uncharacterized protein n=1 Tax=Nocardioides bruguierae TaxID=2945102 RepID=A0A9X2IFL1_9ACTN|nr:hypothetical protein [Nocardioides bruguierae]MCM0621951.1 hypothetical protein [Nocardioides bruguierae]